MKLSFKVDFAEILGGPMNSVARDSHKKMQTHSLLLSKPSLKQLIRTNFD